MSGYTVSPMIPGDLIELDLQDDQLGERQWHSVQSELAALVHGYRAFTVRDGAGRVIFCGGAVEKHAGYATLWAMFGKDKRNGLVFIHRRTRQFLESLPHARVDTFVEGRLPRAADFVQRLGMKREATLRGAAPDGGSMIIFVREFR